MERDPAGCFVDYDGVLKKEKRVPPRLAAGRMELRLIEARGGAGGSGWGKGVWSSVLHMLSEEYSLHK